ncbi:MAG: SRPBCC family protein [Actinomycetota bacterium]
MRIRVGVTIDAPPSAVWDVLEPIERHTEWMSDAQSITFTGDRTRGVGTRFDCVTKIGPFHTLDRMVVTEWVAGRRMGIEHHGLVTGRGHFSLTRRRRTNGTRFIWTERLRFPWWLGGPVGAFAARPILRRIWRANLGTLKYLVESRTA